MQAMMGGETQPGMASEEEIKAIAERQDGYQKNRINVVDSLGL